MKAPGPKELQIIALRERNLAGKPKPTIDDLRALAEAAGAPKPKKEPKGRIVALPDEIPEGSGAVPCATEPGSRTRPSLTRSAP